MVYDQKPVLLQTETLMSLRMLIQCGSDNCEPQQISEAVTLQGREHHILNPIYAARIASQLC